MQLKTKMIVGSLASLVLLSTVLILGWQYSDKIADQQYEDAVLNGRSALWKKIISQEYAKMKGESKRVKRNKKVIEGISIGQNDVVTEYALYDYNGLSGAGFITNLSLTNSTGKIVFSAEKAAPNQYAAATDYVLKKSKVRYDVVIDLNGNAELIYAFPLYFKRKVIGVGVFAKSLEKAVADFAKSTGTTAYILTTRAKKC